MTYTGRTDSARSRQAKNTTHYTNLHLPEPKQTGTPSSQGDLRQDIYLLSPKAGGYERHPSVTLNYKPKVVPFRGKVGR